VNKSYVKPCPEGVDGVGRISRKKTLNQRRLENFKEEGEGFEEYESGTGV